MDCPRCKLPLKAETYEGHQVELCQSCWGMWLEPGELEEILISRQYQFSPEEKQVALKGGVGKSRGPVSPAPCPRCDVRMERLYIDPSLFLVIDRCPRHGLWLDTGEIKTIQAMAERSKEMCRIVIQKIKGLPVK